MDSTLRAVLPRISRFRPVWPRAPSIVPVSFVAANRTSLAGSPVERLGRGVHPGRAKPLRHAPIAARPVAGARLAERAGVGLAGPVDVAAVGRARDALVLGTVTDLTSRPAKSSPGHGVLKRAGPTAAVVGQHGVEPSPPGHEDRARRMVDDPAAVLPSTMVS